MRIWELGFQLSVKVIVGLFIQGLRDRCTSVQNKVWSLILQMDQFLISDKRSQFLDLQPDAD